MGREDIRQATPVNIIIIFIRTVYNCLNKSVYLFMFAVAICVYSVDWNPFRIVAVGKPGLSLYACIAWIEILKNAHKDARDLRRYMRV